MTCTFLYLVSMSAAHAQFHFQGLKGVTAEYGLQSQFDEFFSLGYQSFLSKRFQVEITGGYEQGKYLDATTYEPYEVAAQYRVRNFYLNETIDYSFLRIFRHVYFNLGVGLTQAYQQVKNISMHSTIDSAQFMSSDEIPEFDPDVVRLKDQMTLGGHANILTEIYLSRYLTLLARYRYTYFLRSHFGQTVQQTTVGIRFNF